MKRLLLFLLTAVFFLTVITNQLSAQDTLPEPKIITGVYHGESRPLKDIPPLTKEEFDALVIKGTTRQKSKSWVPKERKYPFAETALPKGEDPIWQKEMGAARNMMSTLLNFDGQTSPYKPSDVNGDVNETHYMQTINTVYAIYNKQGVLLAGPTNLNQLFSGVTGAENNDGDPIVLWDEAAQRWMVAEFSIAGSNDYMLVAVSTTSDPTGTWHKYSFDVDDMPDYEKLGVWRDGYYMGTNTTGTNKKDIYVLERSQMLVGGTARMVGFDNPWRPNSGFHCVPPADNDGTLAPEGSPGIFITINDDAWGGADQLWIYELAVNWSSPASSTFTRTQQINVPAFDSNFGSTWSNITQKGTTQKLDAVNQVIMHRPQYRNFGTHQTLLACHTVDVNGNDQAGVRWYELRRTGSGPWTVRQSGTYAPDSHSRWMASIAMTPSGKIGLSYSISSATLNPGIRYTGQSSAAYTAGNGIMDIAEEVILEGTLSQTGINRWGDYFMLAIDPSDNETFWATAQYVGANNSSKTRIATFKLGNAPIAITLPATNITSNSATINGTVNPNTLATTYYFEWGTSSSYGSTSSVISAGSGSTAQNVNTSLSSLTPGTTYHYRVVATNADGSSYGENMTFSPGGAQLTTTAISSVQTNSAISGGNITSDGGSPITARGVCWGTTANPVLGTGNFTTDGTGTGAFASSIQGLNSNTTYHVRAYATNSFGTFYGNNISFQTLCGIITSFPWTEGFENGGSIPSCWTQEQVNSSGVNWQFITGNGTGQPANAYSGTYNACLKDITAADNKTRLITPPLNLTSISNPVLTFYHTQVFWSPDQDILTVFYRTSASGAWTQLAQYTASVTTWTLRTINLPSASAEYYIAFEGNAKYGRGVCIDEVSVNGTSLIPSLAVTPSNQNQSAAAGSVNFTVASNVNWSASSNQTWCTVTSNGSGNGTLTATVTENTGQPQRIAQITVSAPDVSPVIVTVTQAGATLTPYANVLLRPQQIDLSATTAQSAVLMEIGNYSTNDVKYRLYNGGNQYNCWDGTQFVTSSTYAVNPSVPGAPTSVSIWWIIFERGSNNSTAASYRDRLSPYSANNITVELPASTTITNPFNIDGTLPFSASYPLDQRYIVLGYDAEVSGNLITATSSAITSGAYSLKAENGTIIRRIEVRNVFNQLMESQTGTWPSVSIPVIFALTGGGSYCQGTQPTAVGAQLSGSESGVSYQLLKNGIASGATIAGTGGIISWSNLTAGSYTVEAMNTSGTVAMNGSVEVVELLASTASVSISATQNSVCQGTSVTFTAFPENGGATPAYQWKINGQNVGTNNSAFTYVPNNNDQIQVVMTSSLECVTGNPAISNGVAMTVSTSLPAGVSISATQNSVCQGTSVTFTAFPDNGGTTPAYQWKVNGQNAGTNNSTFNYTPLGGDQVQVVMTSSLTCVTGNPASSNVIAMTVSNSLPAGVSISATQNSVCQGTSVTFTAFPENGGAMPSYQWKVNGQNAGTNNSAFTYVPNNNDQIQVVMTSSLECVTGNPAISNGVAMTVSTSLPAGVSISATQNSVCQGTSVTFTAFPENGGTTPAYQWKVNGQNVGTNNSTFTFIPNNNDQIQVVMTSSLACVTGNPAISNGIAMTVSTSLPAGVSISATQSSVCQGTSVTFTAFPENGGTTPAYQWKVNGQNAGTNNSIFNYTPLDGDQVQVVMTSSLACVTGNPATSNVIAMTVNPVVLSVTANPSAAGTATYSGTPIFGQSVLLTAEAEDGWFFVNWTNNLNEVLSTNTSFSLNVSSCNPIIKANFSAGNTLAGKLAYFNNVETQIPTPYTDGAFFVQIFDGLVPASAPQQLIEDLPFSFNGLESGKNYTMRIWEETTNNLIGQTWAWNNWGGVTALDALIVSYMVVENPVLSAFPWIRPAGESGYTPFFSQVADANNSTSITSLDALILLYRSVDDPLTIPFPGGRHNFQIAGKKMTMLNEMAYPVAPDMIFVPNGIYMAASQATSVFYEAQLPQIETGTNIFNIYLVATGDLNASYNPGNPAKSHSALSFEGIIAASVGDEILIPVRIKDNVEIAASSLEISYNSNLLEVLDVIGFEIFNIDHKNGVVKAVWIDEEGRNFNQNDQILALKVKILNDISVEINYLEILPGTEFSDKSASVLNDVFLTANYIETSPTAVNALSELELLHNVFPNPFKDQTNIQYTLPKSGKVRVKVFNHLGQQVKLLADEMQSAGKHNIKLNYSDLSGAGAYFYQITYEVNNQVITKRGTIMLTK